MEARVDAEDYVALEVVVGEHHALGESCGAGGVVDFGYVVLVDVGIVDVCGGEAVGVAAHAVGQFLQVFARLSVHARGLGQDGPALEREDGLDSRELFKLDILEYRL